MKYFLCFIIIIVLIYSYKFFTDNNSPVHISYSFQNNQDYSAKINNNCTLLIWNIHKENHTIEFQKDFNDLLQTYEPDFIILQEYIYNQKFTPNTHFNNIFAPNIYKSSIRSFSGILNSSKYQATNTIPILSTDTEPLFNTPKVSLITTYRLKDIKFSLVNIHALNFNLNNDGFIRQIQNTLTYLNSTNIPIIFAGDFNTWNKKKLQSLNSLMLKNNLKHLKLEHTNVKKIFGYPLDHVYYNKYIKILNFKVLNTISSDHNPIILNFKISR